MNNSINIEIVFSTKPRHLKQLQLTIAANTTLQEVLKIPLIVQCLTELDITKLSYGIWNKKANVNSILKDGDRLEIYRQLKVDPKVARRERFQQQGAKTTGLFAKRRKGAKAGY